MIYYKGDSEEDYLGLVDVNCDKVIDNETWSKLRADYNEVLGQVEDKDKYHISRYENDKSFMQLFYEIKRVLITDGRYTIRNNIFPLTDDTSPSTSVNPSVVDSLIEEEKEYINEVLIMGKNITIGNYLARLNDNLNGI